MASELKTIVLVIVFCYAQFVESADVSTEKPTNNSGQSDSLGYEAVLSKMDIIEYKFLELEFEIKEQNEQIMRNQERLERTHEGMTWMLTRMEQAVSHNFSTMVNQSLEILQQQSTCANHDSLRESIFNLRPIKGHGRMLYNLQHFRGRGPFVSCKVEPSKTSGRYILQPFTSQGTFVGYCEQTKFGGGWLVIQHRYDGSVDFYRNWNEYKKGFGEAGKEFWIGLELLHKMTKGKNYQLLVELEDFNGDSKYAKYAAFEIGSEAEKYSLKTLGAYSGTAGDALANHKGMMFTTLDSDNDKNSENCAVTNSGAWWYNSCHYSNLNGKYMTGSDQKSIVWYNFKSSYNGLKYTRMMIREA